MSTPKTVPYEIFDEVRKDRDGWKTRYRQLKAAAEGMERELVQMRRQARDQEKIAGIFGGMRG